jgi:hypothetical protein
VAIWGAGVALCAQGSAAIGMQAKTRYPYRPVVPSRISAKFPDIVLAFLAIPRMYVVPLKQWIVLASEVDER